MKLVGITGEMYRDLHIVVAAVNEFLDFAMKQLLEEDILENRCSIYLL